MTARIFAKIRGLGPLFWIFVFFPTAIAILYFGLVASDVYISESRFVVRGVDRQTQSPLGLLLKGSAFSRSQDDSYTVQDFILSRDALRALDQEVGALKLFSGSDIDPLSRFPGPDFDGSFEALYKFYHKHVEVQVDTNSSISVLTTRAFTAEDSLRMNEILLEKSEQLVNRLNERARQDMIQFAMQEVSAAAEKDKAAALELARYRNTQNVIDPERQTTIPFQQIAKMQEELLVVRTQLAQLRLTAKDNPQIPILSLRAQAIEEAIKAENARITGDGRSLAGKAAEYQRLVLDKEFNDKLLASALTTLEQARNEAERQQLYLERIAQPSLPDKAMEPQRIRNIIAVFVLGLVLWGIAAMLIAGVKEHQD